MFHSTPFFIPASNSTTDELRGSEGSHLTLTPHLHKDDKQVRKLQIFHYVSANHSSSFTVEQSRPDLLSSTYLLSSTIKWKLSCSTAVIQNEPNFSSSVQHVKS